MLRPSPGLRVAHWYAVLSLLGLLLIAAWPPLLGVLALPAGAGGIQTLTGIVTHPLVPPNLFGWLWPAAFIILSALLLRRVLSDARQLVLFSVATLVGGATLVLTSSGQVIFVGGGLAGWAFAAGAVALGVLRWRSISWLWRVFVVWVGLSLLVQGIQFGVPQTALSAAAIAGVALVAIWSRQPDVTVSGDSETVSRPVTGA